jgi:hypothetical protein
MLKISGTVDATTVTLLIAVMFFVAVLVVGEIFWKDDSQLFQVVAGIVSGLVGAMLARVKPEDKGAIHIEKTPDNTQA